MGTTMGRHDISLSASGNRSVLATGLYGPTPVLTASGWRALADLAPGDLVETQDQGLTPVATIRPELRPALWSVHLPPGACGNATALTLPPGQPVLIETRFALPFCGETSALVPAMALEGWRGIAPHVPARTEQMLQLHLHRPGILFAGPGLRAYAPGTDAVFDLMHLLQPPTHPVLPLAAARQLMASLIAEEAGLGLLQAAALRPPNLS